MRLGAIVRDVLPLVVLAVLGGIIFSQHRLWRSAQQASSSAGGGGGGARGSVRLPLAHRHRDKAADRQGHDNGLLGRLEKTEYPKLRGEQEKEDGVAGDEFEVAADDDDGLVNAPAAAGRSDARLLDAAAAAGHHHNADDETLIGPQATARLCARDSGGSSSGHVCRLCGAMQVDNNGTRFVSASVREYLRRHVLVGVVTGSFENFFRVDMGLCTWLAHVPSENLFFFTDNAEKGAAGGYDDNMENRSTSTSSSSSSRKQQRYNHHRRGEDRRRRAGSWHESVLPEGVTFSRAQLKAKGYTIDWIRAQYRFVQGMKHLAEIAAPTSGSDGGDRRDIRWIAIIDDDTVIDVAAFVTMAHRYDLHEMVKADERRQKRSNKKHDDTGEDQHHDYLPPIIKKVMARPNYFSPETVPMVNKRSLRPLYLGEHGWGGAGHFLNFAASSVFLQKSAECVDKFMVKKFYASDVMLKRCMPLIGIHALSDKRLSHCQAAFLRERMLTGRHVSSHAKRDVVPPRHLAMWRMRLYYQVMYHHNRTAFELLMRVGACAYGSSCKLQRCQQQHDADAVAYFVAHSDNNSFVPLL